MEQSQSAPASSPAPLKLSVKERKDAIRAKLRQQLARAPSGHERWTAYEASTFKFAVCEFDRADTLPKIIEAGKRLAEWCHLHWASVDPCYGEGA